MKKFGIETIAGKEVGSGYMLADGSGHIELRGEQFRLKSQGEGDTHRFPSHLSAKDFTEVRKVGEK